ncbi:ribosomal RNA-processing protein 8-like isoform X2 [Macrobrachium nipponense]|uniref:ribosomal RNA-processing protein 8-like isoform X2 n=1 Tax=Macrobrachium nipponense TaxID=159736 RepID=UPI0030C80F54
MDIFEDPEWGNSTEFSYYRLPGAKEFKVSSSLLETSLERLKKKSKIDSKIGQGKEKQKHAEEGTEVANTLKKNKKNKYPKEKESEVDGKTSEGGQSNTSNTPKSNNKSNVKKLAEKNSNSDNVNSLDNAEDHADPVRTPVKKKKKKKNANKRNRYKELNIEQNKKKNVTLVNGEFQEQSSHHEVISVSNSVGSENDTNNEVRQQHDKATNDILETTNKPQLNSLKLDPNKGHKVILEKADDKIKPKSHKVKKKKSTLPSDQIKESVTPDVESNNCSTNMTSKKKGKKASESITKDSKISEKISLDNKKGKKRKLLNDESAKKKTKTNGVKKKNKSSKDSGICNIQEALGDKESKDVDDEEVDSKLREDLEDYLNKLDFSNVNNGIAYDAESSGSMETLLLGNISDSGSEDEYIEDEALEETTILSEKAVAGKEKASKSSQDKSKIISLTDGSKSLSAVGKNNKKPLHPLNPTVGKKEGAKFDKDILNRMLKNSEENNSNDTKAASGNPALSAAEELREKMKNQLNAARFRLVNEQMYTATSSEAAKLFKSDPKSFEVYHTGFKAQVARWPVNPLDKIIKWLQKKPNTITVADFGCGEAVLAASVPQKEVYSFDLVALNPRVTVCDMAHTPLPSKSVDVAVFCLSLMGTNIKDFVLEASRVLKKGPMLHQVVHVAHHSNDCINMPRSPILSLSKLISALFSANCMDGSRNRHPEDCRGGKQN